MVEVIEEIDGVKYVFEGIPYKQFKSVKRNCGDNNEMFEDTILIKCCKEPKLTLEEIDEMDVGKVLKLKKALMACMGLNLSDVKNF